MSRCCLEGEVGISAIINDAKLGSQYINFDAHAKKRLLDLQRSAEGGHGKKFAEMETYMKSQFIGGWPDKARTSWYGFGFPALCKKANMEDRLSEYVVCCQVTHGTITGLWSILNIDGLLVRQPAVKPGYRVLAEQHCLRFLMCTKVVVELIFGSLWTPDGHRCKNELNAIGQQITESLVWTNDAK